MQAETMIDVPVADNIRDGAWDFGYRVLGPIFAEYLFNLDLHIAYFRRQGDPRILFVSRAGIRLRSLYGTWLKANERSEPDGCDTFFVSRIACLKGTWRTNPAGFATLLAREFNGGLIRDVARALYGDQAHGAAANLSHIALDGPVDQFSDFLWGPSEPADALRWHLDQQSGRFARYAASVIGDARSAVLVDSGWQGTSQRILAGWRPDIDWWGLYFGRMGQPLGDRRDWDRVVGLCFEHDRFDPSRPRSAITLHRHLIEGMLEPDAPSVESYVEGDDGSIVPVGADGLLADTPTRETAPLFDGVRTWLRDMPNARRPSSVLRASAPAETTLARVLAFPTAPEVAMLSLPPRSADMGRTFSVPILHEARERSDGDTPESRIADALWTQGAVALEYPPELARKRLALTFDTPADPDRIGYADVKPLRPTADVAAVAVITRTRDRPMFLRRALESVFRQDFDDYLHVVVCDGGDISEVREVIETSGADLRRIMLIDNVRNRGMEAASNIAIRHCQSEFIVIHDDDDSWEPGFLSASVGFLREDRHRGYGGVITGTWYVSEEVTPGGIVVHNRYPYNDWIEQVPLTEMACNNMFAPIAFTYRRSVYDSLGGYDESFPVLGDWDFNLRFLLASDIGVIRHKLASYHHRDVGAVRLFGNSLYEQRAKHAEYHAILRNKYIRMTSGQFSGLAGPLIAASSIYGELRSAVRLTLDTLRGSGGTVVAATGGAAVLEASADERWVMLTRLFGDYVPGAGTTDSALIVPSPPDFDDDAYLRENPDVAAAILRGEPLTAFGHFFAYGRTEGRRRPRRG